MSQHVRRSVPGFILSIISGILVVLNAAALLSPGFYGLWGSVFFWLPAIGPASLAFAMATIIGLILIIGSILMLLGYGTLGSILVLPLTIISLIIGGGFMIGFFLGIVGGILGMLRRDVRTFQTPTTTMFCRECGAKIPRISKYCPECGYDFRSPDTRIY